MEKMREYILEGKTPVQREYIPGTFKQRTKRVAYTDIDENIYVSTVFLTYDHNWEDVGPPLLFETMVFGARGIFERWLLRYSTWYQAEEGHDYTVRLIKYSMLPWYKKIFKRKPVGKRVKNQHPFQEKP
jgi:hypothetical protein